MISGILTEVLMNLVLEGYRNSVGFSAKKIVVYRGFCDSTPLDQRHKISNQFRRSDVIVSIQRGNINLTVESIRLVLLLPVAPELPRKS